MAINETIIAAILGGSVTVFGMWISNRTTAKNSDKTNETTAGKNLDDAQQKLLESTLKELHDTQTDARATRKEIEENLAKERERNALLWERLNLALESNGALRQRLTEIEVTKDVIGAVEHVETKQIEEYKG